LFLADRKKDRLTFLRKCILASRADGVAFLVWSWAAKRPSPEDAVALLKGIENAPTEDLEKTYLERMERRYGLAVGSKDVDLNFSYWLAFRDWGMILEKSVWATRRDLQREFWKRYISSPQQMADFARFVIEPFAIQGNFGPPISQIKEYILPEEDLRDRARKYPPYQDPVALSYLQELLGEDFFPKPLSMGTTKSNPDEEGRFSDDKLG
jgi:hypothetical protein